MASDSNLGPVSGNNKGQAPPCMSQVFTPALSKTPRYLGTPFGGLREHECHVPSHRSAGRIAVPFNSLRFPGAHRIPLSGSPCHRKVPLA